MKKRKLVSIALIFFAVLASAQYKKDGTPDMRYKSNRDTYGSSYSTPSSSYGSSSDRSVNGYVKDNGTYVEPYTKTRSNNTNTDNYSTQGNTNPYTNSTGTRARDYSDDAHNYGSGKAIETGPKGGQYYINDNGNKVYVPKQ